MKNFLMIALLGATAAILVGCGEDKKEEPAAPATPAAEAPATPAAETPAVAPEPVQETAPAAEPETAPAAEPEPAQPQDSAPQPAATTETGVSAPISAEEEAPQEETPQQ